MITLVTGPPDSGKSRIAEDLAVKGSKINDGSPLYYIATMVVCDEEGLARVQKHRSLREGKGFTTLEIPLDIPAATDLMEKPERSVVLLECAANLAGNLMYEYPETILRCKQDEQVIKEIAQECVTRISSLGERVADLVVVTSVYEPEGSDDADTAVYKKLLDIVNKRLCLIADVVYDTNYQTNDGSADAVYKNTGTTV